jgi:solute carrier family 30 (zinc transporter), member 1
MIASVHIQVSLPKINRIKRYNQIAKAIRTCLHAYGIHSSTIQPEFADNEPLPSGESAVEVEGMDEEEDTPLLQDSRKGCLFECIGGGECADNRCCDADAECGQKNGKDRKGDGNGTAGPSQHL